MQALGFFPTTTGVLCTVIAANPSHVLVGVRIHTTEGEVLKQVWQPKSCLHRLDMDLREGILNVDLMSYTYKGKEQAVVQLNGLNYANIVGHDQLC